MSNLPKVVKKNLQDILKDEGLLKEEVLGEVVARQKASGVPLHRVLHEMGLLSEIDLLRAISRQLNLPYIDASTYKVSKDVVGLFPVQFMMEHQFTVLDKIGRVLVVATAGPPPAEIVEKIESGLRVTFRYRIEVLRPRGLVGSVLSRREIEVTVEHDSLTRQYRLTRALDGENPQSTATDKEEEMRRWMTELQRVRLPLSQNGVPFPPDAVIRARCRLSSGFVLVFFPYAKETPWLKSPLYAPEAPDGD